MIRSWLVARQPALRLAHTGVTGGMNDSLEVAREGRGFSALPGPRHVRASSLMFTDGPAVPRSQVACVPLFITQPEAFTRPRLLKTSPGLRPPRVGRSEVRSHRIMGGHWRSCSGSRSLEVGGMPSAPSDLHPRKIEPNYKMMSKTRAVFRAVAPGAARAWGAGLVCVSSRGLVFPSARL